MGETGGLGDLGEDINDNTKTPMWQVNKLAKHHKITPVYKLEKEDTKKKTKRFTVSLTLDKEVWNGSGNTKKQAKQNAAKKAVKETTLTQPPAPKKPSLNSKALTATVKLNGWAMANRKMVTYKLCEKRYNPTYNYNGQQQHLLTMPSEYKLLYDNHYNIYSVSPTCVSNNTLPPNAFEYSNPYYYTPLKRPTYFQVCVEIDDEKFYGEGVTQQAARHDAAKKALDVLNSQTEIETADQSNDLTVKVKKADLSKTSVCVLNEEALARGMCVIFNKIDEKGLAHLKYYTVEIIVGHFKDKKLDKKRIHFQAEASGTSKKAAKQAAASQILKEIKEQLPPRKKPEARIEKGPLKGHFPPLSTLHPVSRLMQICQAQKMKPPSYELITQTSGELGENKFTMKCVLKDKEITATGTSKKDAKKEAAESMLILLGKQPKLLDLIPNKDLVPQKSSLKIKEFATDMGKRLQVKFVDDVLKP